jgi:predicted anti-sigma-YlaC factor YlaD
VDHISNDDLESYAMRTLPEAGVKGIDEHLLKCSACRDRLQAAEEYVTAMREAAVELRKRVGENR